MSLYKTSAHYSEEFLTLHKDKIFLFGDNLRGVGKGGQAVIRDMRNALGVPTKHTPTNEPDAFFYEHNFSSYILKVVTDLEYVKRVADGRDIVVPFDNAGNISLGLGLSALDKNSPTTYQLICTYLESLADKHGGWEYL
jgi:hypothetical protein